MLRPLLASALLLGPSAAAPPGDGCIEQLEKDGCVYGGTHACAECGEKHKADLLKANCTQGFVLSWCEHKVPAPPGAGGGGSCGVSLHKQISKRPCTLNVSYGCCAALPKPPAGCNSSTMWTSTGCRGEFVLGGRPITCDGTSTSTEPLACVPQPPPPPPPPLNASTVTVLVFGDSWGSLGPSWHEIQDMFDRHGVPAVVRSTARGGTEACQWAAAGHGAALAEEAAKASFPELGKKGPDHVWYTLGGNDFANSKYQACSRAATSLDEELKCIDTLTELIRGCTQSLLEKYWAAFPLSRVMQCGYDFPCRSGRCVPAPRTPYCGTRPLSCCGRGPLTTVNV